MEEKTVRVMLCKTQQQVTFYRNEMLERIKQSGRPYTAGRVAITDGEDIYKFLTPDDQLLGLRIGGFDECGDVYNHPKYHEAVEVLERSII